MHERTGTMRRIAPFASVLLILIAAATTFALAKPGIVECPGILEPEEWIPLYAPSDGIVLSCALEEGRWYGKGALLLGLDSTRVSAQLEQVKRETDLLKSEQEYAHIALDLFEKQNRIEEQEYQRSLEINRHLYAILSISRNDMERSEFLFQSFLASAFRERSKLEQELRKSESSLLAKMQEQEYLEDCLKRMNLFAPASGFYLALETVYTTEPEMLVPLICPGRKLEAGHFLGYLIPGESLASSIRIPERFAGDCHVGMDVRLSVSSRPVWRYPPLHGRLAEIAPFASDGSYRARVLISLGDALEQEIAPMAGASLTARIDIRRAGGSISEPPLQRRLYAYWLRWSDWVNSFVR